MGPFDRAGHICRDVNLPLFGGIPLLFFAFLFFRNHFPLFLVSRQQQQKKKKKQKQKTKPVSDADTVRRVQRACHCRESSKRSTVGRVQRASVRGCSLFTVLSQSSKARYLHSALEIRHPQPCTACLEEGEGGGQVGRWSREGGSK